jgi:tRNA C32,U32 (ribose-2'-O)-methylase TrmJ
MANLIQYLENTDFPTREKLDEVLVILKSLQTRPQLSVENIRIFKWLYDNVDGMFKHPHDKRVFSELYQSLFWSE